MVNNTMYMVRVILVFKCTDPKTEKNKEARVEKKEKR